MTPKTVTRLQPAPKGVRVKLFQNLKVGSVWHEAGAELELYRPVADVEALAANGLLAIVDPAWAKAVVVEDIADTEK